MTPLDNELLKLNQSVLEMMKLAKKQMTKTKEAFLTMDTELAEEIMHYESRMDALELIIERDCDNILGLQTPLATDLRFVLAILKINTELERIGDLADGMAGYVIELEAPLNQELILELRLNEMFDMALSMINDVYTAFDKKDAKVARKVFKKDNTLNEINENSAKVIEAFVKKNCDNTRQCLFLFSTIKKLERVGDSVKNVAEGIIYYLEAENIKHKKDK
jgi:phosphate transport system protein